MRLTIQYLSLSHTHMHAWWSNDYYSLYVCVCLSLSYAGDRNRKGKNIVSNPSLKKRTLEQETSCSKRVKEELIPDIPIAGIQSLTPRQETILLNFMSPFSNGPHQMDPSAARLLRKLKVRQKKVDLGRPIFNLDQYVHHSLVTTQHYISCDSDELPHPLICTSEEKVDINAKVTLPFSAISRARAILNRLANPILPVLVPTPFPLKCTADDRFVSPYTSHLLTPHIFRSCDFSPPKIQVLCELVSKVLKGAQYQVKPLIFSYFRKHHLTSVNSLISYFFWPVDLTEYIQYPDFTVVVLYGDKLVIGCGFMTPDVSVSEAYIPFLLVHPDFQHCSIGQIMLYHLIQSCQGKDVILHVSVNNPAMILYQKFGFKVEQFCVNFYDKYYPMKYHLSKHAFLMRLRR